MTKIIVSATHKGGEGKTTNSIILAEYIALILKLRVLAIDMDTQANFSSRYLKMEYDPACKGGVMPPIHPDYDATDRSWNGNERSSIAGIFYGGEAVYPYQTFIPNLEILPAYSSRLQGAELVTKKDVVEKVHVRLKDFLDLPDVKESYDAIIIDTPPSKGPLTIAAIRASTHIVIPAQMEKFSIDGIYGMLQLWKQESLIRKENEKLELVGILPNKVRLNVNIHKQLLESLKETPGIDKYLIPHVITQRTIYTEILAVDAKPKILFDLPKNHVAREEYETVCEFITKRVFNNE